MSAPVGRPRREFFRQFPLRKRIVMRLRVLRFRGICLLTDLVYTLLIWMRSIG
jgi:hypothetical protein